MQSNPSSRYALPAASHHKCIGSASALALPAIMFTVCALSFKCEATEHGPASDEQRSSQRVTSGLQVLYDFRAVEGGVVRDLSNNNKALNLVVREPKKVVTGADGLVMRGKSTITSDSAAAGLISELRRSGAMSVELWMRPQSLTQTGPARLITLSKNGNERNFTLGQDGDKLDFRLRTTATSTNGIPSLTTKGGVMQSGVMHVVGTHSRSDGRVDC